MTRTPFDRFAKQLVRDAVEGRCSVETDAEVPADARRIDLWVTPRDLSLPLPDHLGLLGRIVRGPATLEFFHGTPTGEDLRVCLIKHGEFWQFLSRRKTLPPPIQWIISAGRPDIGIDGLGFHPTYGGPPGLYDSPLLHYTRLVVVSELPVRRDTLLVRLFGAGAVLKHAIAELHAMPAEAPERRLALPVLLSLSSAMPSDPAQQTRDDQEFLMNTQEIVEAWRQELLQEGVKQGIQEGVRQGIQEGVRQGIQEGVRQGVKQGQEQGERRLLLRQLRRRFGEIDGETERRVAAASVEQIEIWADRVLSVATLADLLAD